MKKTLFFPLWSLALLYGCASTPVDPRTRGAQRPDPGLPVAPRSRAPGPPPAGRFVEALVFYEYDKYDIRERVPPGAAAHGKYLAENRGRRCSPRQLRRARQRGIQHRARGNASRRGQAHARADGRDRSAGRAVSLGEEKPRCTEHAEDAWSQNRRATCSTRRILGVRAADHACALGRAPRGGPRGPVRRRRGAQADLPAEKPGRRRQKAIEERLPRSTAPARAAGFLRTETGVDLAQLIESLKQDVAKLPRADRGLSNQTETLERRQKDPTSTWTTA